MLSNKKWRDNEETITFIVLMFVARDLAVADDFGIKFSGFVRGDMIYDSRQCVRAREHAIMLFPRSENIPMGQTDDINANGSMTMFVLHTRVRGLISGPDAFGAKTRAFVEGEFFGMSDNDAGGFRVRHAYMDLDWGKTDLRFGQYWNPMLVVDVLPNFNFSSPFLAYGRRPQLRLTQQLGKFELSGTASWQSDFKSKGPGPDDEHPVVSSNDFIRNAKMPSLNLHMMYRGETFLCGLAGDYKKLRPTLASDETIGSYSGLGYMKITTKPVVFKLQGLYTQNMTDCVMLGGYAVRAADESKYTNLNIVSAWTEISTGEDIKLSLYAGYSKNLGTDDAAVIDKNKIYALGANIDNLLRVAPSVIVKSGSMKFVTELEYTAAEYGDFKNDKLELGNLQKVDNIRLNIALIYLF